MKFSGLMASAAFALSLAAVTAPAHAATVVLNETLDLSTPQQAYGFTAGWRGFGSFSPAFAFDLVAGDTLDFTLQFAAGQSLTLINPTFFWLFSYGSANSEVNATGSLAFLDAGGTAFLTSNLKTDDEGVVHFGQNFEPGDFAVLPSVLTFQGLHYVGKLNSFADPSVTTSHYADPQVLFSADSARLLGVAVPEPGTWALMLLGFGGLGATLRRQRRLASTTA